MRKSDENKTHEGSINHQIVSLVDTTGLEDDVLDILDYIENDMRSLNEVTKNIWLSLGETKPLPFVKAWVDSYFLYAETEPISIFGDNLPIKLAFSLDEENISVEWVAFYIDDTQVAVFEREDNFEYKDDELL